MVQIINITTVGDELAIAWSDGKENYIPLEKLRKACPCAICQGEPDAMGLGFDAGSLELMLRFQSELGGLVVDTACPPRRRG